jgi:GNAT superfamily N-acetyltransferase
VRAVDTRSRLFREGLALVSRVFPPSEMHPARYMRRWARQGTYLQDVAVVNGNVAFAAWHWRIYGTRVQMLDYLAVDPSARGFGLADAYLSRFVSRYATGGRLALIELERKSIEKPNRQWLYLFYRKHGARLLSGVDFILPPLTSGKPEKMGILLFGVRGKTVPGALARKLCSAIYDANDEFSPPGTRKERRAMLATFLERIPKTVRLV